MPDMITLLTATMPSNGMQELVEAWSSVASRCAQQPGFRSMCVWRDCDLPLRYGVTIVESLPDGTDEPVVWPHLLEGDELTNLLAEHDMAPDVRHLIVRHHTQAWPDEIQVGAWMSVSLRVAEMGFAAEMEEELQEIFLQLRDLSGYAGSVIARLYNLEEEIIGIVFWSDEGSFERSLPRKSLYEVRLFQRVA